MADSLGGIISAVPDVYARRAFGIVSNKLAALDRTISTVSRNNQNVLSHADLTNLDFASAGHTGFASLSSLNAHIANVSNPHVVTITQAAAAGGNLPVANLDSGTGASSSTFWRGDGTWVAVASPTGANPTASVGLTAVNGSASTFMRSDGAPALSVSIVPTWTGVHTFSAKPVFNAGVDLGTSGRLDSNVVMSGAGASNFLHKPTTTAAAGDYIHHFQNQAGATMLVGKADGTWEFGGTATSGGYITAGATTTQNAGIQFVPTLSGAGTTILGLGTAVTGAYFASIASTSPTATRFIGASFASRHPALTGGNTAPVEQWGGVFSAQDVGAAASGFTFSKMGGWKIASAATTKNAGTATDLYGGYIANISDGTGLTVTNGYSLYIEENTRGGTIKNGIFLANATAGYKAIVIRDQNVWVGSAAAGELTLNGTTVNVANTNLGFYSVAGVARATTAGAASTFVANTSLIVDDSATWDGYTVGQVVKALRNVGLLT